MNTNSARKTRAVVALTLLAVASFISLIIIIDAVKYGEKFSFYLTGMALWEAVGAYAIALVLFGWNAVTYRRPRYARHGE